MSFYVDNNFVFTDVNGYPLVIKTAIMDKSYFLKD